MHIIPCLSTEKFKRCFIKAFMLVQLHQHKCLYKNCILMSFIRSSGSVLKKAYFMCNEFFSHTDNAISLSGSIIFAAV